MKDTYVKSERVQLKDHPDLNEKWVQDIIADDPAALGLGELLLIERERKQPSKGRLDLLFRDSDAPKRYEVEVQLGATDESHVIRAIEYWDWERKLYPQYDHCAVLVAEDIKSRFLNVISLFNGTLPFVAIQMQALRVGENLTLVFTKVMDELSRGPVDSDEGTEPVDRTYWENRATRETVALADRMLQMFHNFDSALTLNYNKHYIGLKKNGDPLNFVIFKPIKRRFRLLVYIPQSDESDDMVRDGEFETLPYSDKSGCYRLYLREDEIESKSDILLKLTKIAYDKRAVV